MIERGKGTDAPTGAREIADLLPFYAAGTLRSDDRARVEAELIGNEALRGELALVREEQHAAIDTSEVLGAPSPQARERLFALLDAATASERASHGRFDLAAWLGARLDALRPRALGFAAMALALLVVAQAGYIELKVRPAQQGAFQTASHEDAATKLAGTIVVVAFAPNARAVEIGKLLEANGASIVAGPLAGGLYQLRIGDDRLGTRERDRIIASLKANPAVVRFAAPASSAGPD